MINLSVIVPFFNEEQFLQESVDRLLSNDIYSSIYLIDNNSTLKMLENVEKIRNKDMKFIFKIICSCLLKSLSSRLRNYIVPSKGPTDPTNVKKAAKINLSQNLI